MIKIRLQGKKEDIEKSIPKIAKNFIILSESEYYKNRNSEFYRLYLELEVEEQKEETK